ncbi:Uncharacterized protein Fot_31995 [Forsythia ovata]|uniref:Uncharacterized protein n=1 Tax=Forsythia ovata TaxID=205694 RepID=A0ABD1T6I4_9LAMI
MDNQLQILEEFRMIIEENQVFYIKATKKDPQTDQLRYDIIFMMEPSSTSTKRKEHEMDDDKDITSVAQTTKSMGQQLSSSTTKRMLFQSPGGSCSNPRHCVDDNALLKTNDPKSCCSNEKILPTK